MKLKYGYSYYPELCCSQAEIMTDIDLIEKSGANVVRMGEFAWDQLEKKEGDYDFTVFDKTIAELGKRGISTVFCTPTSCPPSWLMKKHPEIGYVDNRGVKRPFGARHHYCYNNEVYRSYSKKIVEEIAGHYADNPYVIGFQIGNEFAQESSGRCHCPTCTEKFRQFLKTKYQSIERFNQACGTYFWGESFSDFSDIYPPVAGSEPDSMDLIRSYYDNPGLRLNFEIFASESFCEYLNIQREALSRCTYKVITSNSTGVGTNLINYYRLYENLDAYGMDLYPSLSNPDYHDSEFSYALAFSVKKKPFWMLEFSIGGGHGLWAKEGRLQPVPGAIELSAMHAFASGAELLTHFQYKAFRSGAEQLNYALLDADRKPRRRYFEFSKTAKMLDTYADVLENTKVAENQAAILFDYQSLWALKLKPVNHDFSYVGLCADVYYALRRSGYYADVISPEMDFSGYSLLITPAMIIMSEACQKRLRDYVKNGGTLVSTFLTSVKDEHNVAYDCSFPAGLTEVFGAEVSEVEPVFEESRRKIEFRLDETINSENFHWIDELTLRGANAAARFTEGYRRGNAVASRHKYGAGCAYYLGTKPNAEALRRFLSEAAQKAELRPLPFPLPEGVTAIRRTNTDNEYYFVFNFNQFKTVLTLNGTYSEAASGKQMHALTLPPLGYACLGRRKSV